MDSSPAVLSVLFVVLVVVTASRVAPPVIAQTLATTMGLICIGVVLATEMPVSPARPDPPRIKFFDAHFALAKSHRVFRNWDEPVPLSKPQLLTGNREMDGSRGISRRDAVRLIGASAAGLLLPVNASSAQSIGESSTMLSRPIHSSGEKLPVIGLGTWQTFDVDASEAERKPLEDVLHTLVKLGGRVIDSSPMYGRAEEVIGDLVAKLRLRDSLFLATKVWTRGKQSGIDSMERSFGRLRTKTIDLMQVHNLVDVTTHLATMREWKQRGRVRYIGITHYEAGAFGDVARILASEKLDFVQINYSIAEREAEEEILPLAQQRGVAVIANRPFGGGDLFSRVRGKPLPNFAKDFDCTSWAQFFLKWIVAHSAVTCAIPATNNVRHLEDNIGGGVGRLPDVKMRARMMDYISN